MKMRAIRSLTSLAAIAALALVGSAASAANYVFTGKFTSNRGKSAQVPLVGLTQAGAKINGCGGLTFMSGPGVAGTVTPMTHPNKVGINQRGAKDLGCVPESAPGIKLATTGKGVGGAFTLPVKAWQNNAPMTTINAIGVTTIPGVLQFATNNSVTGPPVARLESPMGTMLTGCVGTGGAKLCKNQAKFRAFKAAAWMSQTGRVGANFTWCPPLTGMTSGVGGPCTKIGQGGFHEIIRYKGGANGFGGTLSYLTKQVAPGSLVQAAGGGLGIVVPFGTVGQNGMLATLATGRGYADHHVDKLLPASGFASHMEATVPRPIVGPQRLVTMLGAGPIFMAGTGIAHGWGFPLTTGTVLVRNTGTLQGNPHNSTFTAKGYDKLTAMGQRNISLVAGAIGVGLLPPPTGNVPTIDLVTAFMPEPGTTLQLLAGVASLLGIAAWRSRRNR